MRFGTKLDLTLWAFMAVMVVLIALVVLDERARRTAQVGENSPYPYPSDLAIVAQADTQTPSFPGYVTWDPNLGAWRSQDAQDGARPYRRYIALDGVPAVLERRRDPGR